jgi:hypothetical protein
MLLGLINSVNLIIQIKNTMKINKLTRKLTMIDLFAKIR